MIPSSPTHIFHKVKKEVSPKRWKVRNGEVEIVTTDIETAAVSSPTPTIMKGRRVDSLLLEAGNVSVPSAHNKNLEESWSRTLNLAFQCLRVIYGDIGTSPLYVYSSTFQEGIYHKDDINPVYFSLNFTAINYTIKNL